jgi:L-2-hydroxyglutarate oxidase
MDAERRSIEGSSDATLARSAPGERVCDYLIVGAGIIGLTIAWELRRRYPRARIVILEKEASPGLHASGRNSGVLHSGIYYASDTLKAKVCATGAARMREFAAEHGIRCEKSGKVIVASSEQDLPSVEKLIRNAQGNGIRFEKLDAKGVRELEPHARVHEVGLHSPDTAVIDSLAVVKKLVNLLTAAGVEIVFGGAVRAIDAHAGAVVTTQGDRTSYGYLFNCAGANADRIARGFGLCEDYALVPFKGIYYKLRKERDHLVNSNIYPVPDLFLPFLGVHLTRVASGDVYVGPTAIPALGRENYGVFTGIRPIESIGIAWRMASMYARNQQNFRRLVHTEIRKYSKQSFLKAAQKLVPELTSDDLISSPKVGIRPQLVNLRKRTLEMDYIFENTERSLHVLNSISPAFTSSFAFAELVVDRYENRPQERPVESLAAKAG